MGDSGKLAQILPPQQSQKDALPEKIKKFTG